MNGFGVTSAMNGIQTSLRAFDRSAAAVAQATAGSASATDGSPDLVDGMVGASLAGDGVKANLAVLRTADEMLGTLLDIQA
jgi:X-X-X-Leu-X-X-Gly heptad repeat protein